MSMDYAMQDPTRKSTIHTQVTKMGETAQRLLKLMEMLAVKLGRVMGPAEGNKQATREGPGPLGSLAVRVSEPVTMLGHVVEHLQSIVARLDT
jgi:hypothetical protein